MRQLHLKHTIPLFILSTVLLTLFGCEKTYDTIIDSTGDAPVISDVNYSLSIVNTDTINIGEERRPDDILVIRGIASVKVKHPVDQKEITTVNYNVIRTSSSSSFGEGTLRDDSTFPDGIAGDSIYTGYVDFYITRVEVGYFHVEFWSESRTDHKSNTAILPVQIVRLNHPPIISDLIAPSIIYLSQSASDFEISVKVIDIDGQADIKSMLRFTPSGKILRLYPSNDSIYTETVSLTPSPAPGSYLFRFVAVDRSNDSSNVLFHTIVIAN